MISCPWMGVAFILAFYRLTGGAGQDEISGDEESRFLARRSLKRRGAPIRRASE